MSRDIKIVCHSCKGNCYVEDVEYQTNKVVKTVCPECNGKGYIMDMRFIDDDRVGYKKGKKYSIDDICEDCDKPRFATIFMNMIKSKEELDEIEKEIGLCKHGNYRVFPY